MAVLDWVFLAVLAASLLLGAWRGLVYEVLSVMSWIAAFIVAQWLAADAAAALPLGSTPDAGRYAIGFVAVFIAVVFAGGLLAWLTKKLVQAVGLRRKGTSGMPASSALQIGPFSSGENSPGHDRWKSCRGSAGTRRCRASTSRAGCAAVPRA